MKTAISQMKNTLDRINGRFDIAEEKFSEPEDVTPETIQNETEKIRIIKSGKSISEH